MSKTIKPISKVFPHAPENSNKIEQIKETPLEDIKEESCNHVRNGQLEDNEMVLTGKPLEDTNAKVKKKIKKIGKSMNKPSLFANSTFCKVGKINLDAMDKGFPAIKDCNANKGMVSIPVKLNRTEVYKIKKKIAHVSALK